MVKKKNMYETFKSIEEKKSKDCIDLYVYTMWFGLDCNDEYKLYFHIELESGKFYKTEYGYKENKTFNSREFCHKKVSLQKSYGNYRAEFVSEVELNKFEAFDILHHFINSTIKQEQEENKNKYEKMLEESNEKYIKLLDDLSGGRVDRC